MGEVLFPLTALFVAYVWILCIAQKSLFRKLQRDLHLSNEDSENGHHDGKKTLKAYNRNQFHLAQIFGAIFTANIITWVPMVIMFVVIDIQGVGYTLFYTIAYLSFLAETVIHPILEACLIKEIWSTNITSKFFSRTFKLSKITLPCSRQ